MFKGLFGGKKEEIKVNKPQAQATPSEKDQEFKNQEKLVSIKKATEESRQNVEKFYEKLTRKEAQIKELLKQNKRDEARRQLALFKTMKDQIVNLENLCTTLEKELIKLEVSMQSANLVKALQTANELQKDQEKLRDNLENIVMDLKEKEAQEAEIKNLLQELSTGNPEENEEIDNMLGEFEKQVMEEKMDNLNGVPVKNHVGIQPQFISPQQSQASTKVSTTVSQIKQKDDLDDLLEQSAQMN